MILKTCVDKYRNSKYFSTLKLEKQLHYNSTTAGGKLHCDKMLRKFSRMKNVYGRVPGLSSTRFTLIWKGFKTNMLVFKSLRATCRWCAIFKSRKHKFQLSKMKNCPDPHNGDNGRAYVILR